MLQTTMTDPKKGSSLNVCVVGGERIVDLLPGQVGQQCVNTVLCSDGEQLLRQMAERVPDVVIMDSDLAVRAEGGLLGKALLRSRDLPIPIIVVGDCPDTDVVVKAMRNGAADFVSVADARDKLPGKVLSHATDHRLLVQVKRLTDVYERTGMLGEMVGVSPAMHDVFATIKNVSSADAPVFLSGESGTGKELAAHAIHMLSSRSEGLFVAVNCAAIPRDLLESELFGHEKGAFTGADRLHTGSCERADGGVLFLDEICEMDLSLQAKLLRFLEDHRFTRVGGGEEITSDTRVIAASNREPMAEVERGSFREDLYYRLNVVPISIPPLRERPEDIPVLAEHFLKVMCEKYLKYFYRFTADAMRTMLVYDWPGNVRELRNTIERIVVLATTDTVTPELFPEGIRKATEGRKSPSIDVERALACVRRALDEAPEPESRTNEVLPFAEVERRAILEAVRKCDGDISKAARKLGLSRATIYRKLEKYEAR